MFRLRRPSPTSLHSPWAIVLICCVCQAPLASCRGALTGQGRSVSLTQPVPEVDPEWGNFDLLDLAPPQSPPKACPASDRYNWCVDVNGKVCKYCSGPRPEYTEYANKDLIKRVDCGNHSAGAFMCENCGGVPLPPWKPSASLIQPPSPTFLPPKTGPPSSWTNGYCETYFEKSCADAEANRDYFYYAAGTVVRPGYTTSFWYCKHNGWLAETYKKNLHNYDFLYEQSAAFCAMRDQEFNISGMTALNSNTGINWELEPNVASPDLAKQARLQAASVCALGGVGCHMAYCAFTFKELGDGHYCMYPEGPAYKGTAWEGDPLAEKWACPQGKLDKA